MVACRGILGDKGISQRYLIPLLPAPSRLRCGYYCAEVPIVRGRNGVDMSRMIMAPILNAIMLVCA